MTDTPEQRFETTLSSLEERVRKLEDGDLAMDDALKLFEEGVDLARTAHEQLEAAEKRVAALSRGPRGVEERPFE